MPAGYSGTPLARKLGIKEGYKVYLINPPDHYFDLFDDLPEIDLISNETDTVDFIHFFSTERNELEGLFPILKKRLSMNGLIWVSWPKKASKVPTDVGDGIVREIGLTNGLVDVKVCAVDEVWSGLKFVYRTKDRK